MKHLKHFETAGRFAANTIKIKSQVIDSIEELLTDFIDDGFEIRNEHKQQGEEINKFFIMLTKPNKNNYGNLRICGLIGDNDIEIFDDYYNDNSEYNKKLEDMLYELIDRVYGEINISFSFSLTNFYEEDKLIIYGEI